MRLQRTLPAHDSSSIPIVVRARDSWTFLGLGLFTAGTLIFCGGYLLHQAIRHPLDASETGVIGAGFLLALAGFVFAYLMWPRAKSCFESPEDATQENLRVTVPPANALPEVQTAFDFRLELSTGLLPPSVGAGPLRRAPEPADSALPAVSDDAVHAQR
jgi:hypothetical protein